MPAAIHAFPTLTPRLVPARGGEYAEMGDHRGYIAMSARDTGGTLAVFVMEADFNGGAPPHIHNREDETFYIQSGQFEFWVDGQTIEAGPGDCVFAPRDIPHCWRCV